MNTPSPEIDTSTADYRQSPYFHIGSARDLSGKDRIVYRALEIFPGALAWTTIALTIILSAFAPVYAALFIIAFDIFWLLKTLYLSVYIYLSFRKVRHNMNLDWTALLANLRYDHIYHLVILPYYKESYEVVEGSVDAMRQAYYDPKKIIIVLAAEERAGPEAEEIAKRVAAKHSSYFAHFLITVHPKDTPGELAGKGSNISYAAERTRTEILDKHAVDYGHVLVSAFDIDTVVYPKYFQCLTWYFLTSERPYRTSYQPVPFYNNNVWDVPAVSRIDATSGTFWQMIQQERPEKLVTFSSHAIPFKTLHDIGYWQTNMVSEDSRIFWNAFMAYNGDYTVTPIFYPISMDANLGPTFIQTLKNIYKQHRRWMWGTDNIPYILFAFMKNKTIPLKKRISMSLVQIDGYWSLATNPIFIFLLGWLPIVIGGHDFNQSILSYNLPSTTRNLMTIGMIGLIFQAILSFSFLPPPPAASKGKLKSSRLFLFLQWFLIPVTIIVFGAIPGLEAQTRLMFGKYMGFWVTPKHRKEKKR